MTDNIMTVITKALVIFLGFVLAGCSSGMLARYNDTLQNVESHENGVDHDASVELQPLLERQIEPYEQKSPLARDKPHHLPEDKRKLQQAQSESKKMESTTQKQSICENCATSGMPNSPKPDEKQKKQLVKESEEKIANIVEDGSMDKPIEVENKEKEPQGLKKQNNKPSLSVFAPEIYAPNKFNHPLSDSKTLNFMIGEDDQGTYLYGEGAIIAGAYKKFLRYVAYYQEKGIKLDRLMLHSPGGLLNEGIMIGKYIHENRWTMDADKYMRCYSTCGFIYAAGTEKRIQNDAEIGFHRPYLPTEEDTPEFIELVYQEYLAYWSLIEGNKELYDTFMREYDREDMYVLQFSNIDIYMRAERY